MIKLAALLLALTSPLAAVDIGGPAPDFKAQGHDGRAYKLSDFKGRTVVLEWLNEDCPFVQKHYGSANMQSLQKKYAKKGVVWLSIASSAPGKEGYFEDAKAAMAFIKMQKAGMKAILLDPEGKVGRAYGAKTTPHMYVVDKEGRLAYQGAIDDTRSTKLEDVKTSKNYVAQALDELLAGRPVSEPQTKQYGCSVKYK